MSSPCFRLAQPQEATAIVEFVNTHFDWKLPLVNRREYFQYYYTTAHTLQFAVAEQDGDYLAVAGYIKASQAELSDIWVSVWVAKKGCNGVGLELMDALPRLTGAQVVACNNIRPKTMAFYRFLGWEAQRLPHYYRLSGQASYQLARVQDPTRLPVSGSLTLEPVNTPEQLAQLGLPQTPHTPRKDLWYLTRRYFAFPHQSYQVYSACQDGTLLAYVVLRLADSGCGKALRFVDFIGPDEVLPQLGCALDALLLDSGAEYIDCYCAGIAPHVFEQAGFCQRLEDCPNILPNYLNPPLFENTEYYYFTNQPDQFVLFKADGDQDRPNLPAE